MPQDPIQIARDALERYTGSDIDEFGEYILLTNFPHYVDYFADNMKCKINKFNWSVAHNKRENISILNFGIGSPLAGMCLDVLSSIKPIAVLMLGLCGGLDERLEIGDYIIPMASIRNEGTSDHYLQPDVPALASFRITSWLSHRMHKMRIKFHTGIMKTTDYRMWEFNEKFKKKLIEQHIIAIDMEIATLFTISYKYGIPIGALMLVSDMPLREGGVKTKKAAKEFFNEYTDNHIKLGIELIRSIRDAKHKVLPALSNAEW